MNLTKQRRNTMSTRIHLAVLGAAVLLAAGAAAAQGGGGAGFMRSEAAQPPMMKQGQMTAMHEAMRARPGSQPTYDGWSFVDGEAGWLWAPQATTSAPAVRIAAPAVQPYGEVSADGWKLVGGEAGWVRAQHRYEFQGGKLAMVHEPWCVASHDLPVPSKSSLPGQKQQWDLYPGA
jgi:hypothetical protein